MNKIIVATLFAGAAALTSPAFAQDTNSTFTGPRVEGLIGYDHVGAGSDIDNDNGRDDQSVDGLLYGLGIGYDIAVGGAVLGVEAELTDSTAKSDRHSYVRSEEHTSELQSLLRISYAVFCLKKKTLIT